MATINDRKTVDLIIKNNGWYPGDDIPVVRIVEYNNQFNGAIAWGLIFQGEDLDRYHNSEAVHNPRIIWEIAEFPAPDQEEVKLAIVNALCDIVWEKPDITLEELSAGITDAQLEELCVTREQYLAAAEGVLEGMGDTGD